MENSTKKNPPYIYIYIYVCHDFFSYNIKRLAADRLPFAIWWWKFLKEHMWTTFGTLQQTALDTCNQYNSLYNLKQKMDPESKNKKDAYETKPQHLNSSTTKQKMSNLNKNNPERTNITIGNPKKGQAWKKSKQTNDKSVIEHSDKCNSEEGDLNSDKSANDTAETTWNLKRNV